MAGVQLGVLGPVEARADGRPVPVGGRKQRTVLALLVAEVGRVVSVDALIEGVWGDDPTPGARSTLQTYVSNLRGALGDVIVRDGGGYRLALEPQQVDAVEFAAAVASAGERLEAQPAAVAADLRQALALWRGHPYADVTGPLRLDLEARRLEELRLRAVEARVEAELALGLHAELLPELEVLCAEFPLQEGFRAQHMLALYRSGRQAEALQAFTTTQTYLVEELGIDSSTQLQELQVQILNQDSALLLPAGTQVQTRAFLAADIEDSAALWHQHPERMRAALAHRDRLLEEAVTASSGRIVEQVGDRLTAAFPDVGTAVTAAERGQRALAGRDWPDSPPLSVRMAVDAGEVEASGDDYAGPVRTRCERLLASAHGGQTLLSGDAHSALAASESGWAAQALGEFRFPGLERPLQVFQLLLDGLRTEFPPLRTDRLPVPAPPVARGRSIRGYELREEVGRGDVGAVFRAYQPSAGREIAVKVIHADLVNRPSFVRRFESDAQVVTQLDHPHIAPLLDSWRDPEGAYLVTRWVRGGTLRAALGRGPWNLEPAIRLLEQVAGALAHAHRHGVAHGDVRPANVLLDEEGDARLTDFAVGAWLLDTLGPARAGGRPAAYLPPEVLEGDQPDARSDLYGLGLLMFEVLTGQLPPMDGALPPLSALRAELPAALDAVIFKATATDPSERYETAEAFFDAFRAGCGAPRLALTGASERDRNPYKGLRAFAEGDAGDFYGRESLTEELVEAVAAHRLVAVVGPSGIGKSSVVKAGLIPALRAGAAPRSQGWVTSEMVPGRQPFEELAAALLRVAVDRPAGLVEELARDELGISRIAKRILLPDTELLLVVDQFEEVFTLTTDEEVRRRFLGGLVRLVDDPNGRVRVVLTMRADFLDHPLRYPELGELVRAGIVAITSPSDDELAQAIQGPAEAEGVRFLPGLVSRIISDVHDQPGALPLLQYALTELFATRTSNLVTLQEYQATGGVLGALGRRAEELYQGLNPAGRSAARQVFLRLVTVDAGGQDTRRRVRRRELRQLELDPAVLDEILRRFGDHRLLTFDREPLTRAPTVEVAHEALLSGWERMRVWVDERREDLLLHRRLVDAVTEWDEAGRRADYLPREGRLAQLEAWAAATDVALTADERAFLAEARAAAEETERRRAARRRIVLAGFGGFAVLASVLAVFAVVQRGEAERQAVLAGARELAAAATSALADDPELSLLLALSGMEATEALGEEPLPEVVEALHGGVSAHRVLHRLPLQADLVAWSPAGNRLAAASMSARAHGDDLVAMVDPGTGAPLPGLAAEDGDGAVTALVFDPGGGRLLTTHDGAPTAVLWDVASGDRLQTLVGHSGIMLSPAFTPDGTGLVVSNDDGTISRWDLGTGTEVWRAEEVRGASSPRRRPGTSSTARPESSWVAGGRGIDVSADGRYVVTAEPELPGAAVRHAEDGTVLHELRTSFVNTHSATFNPAGDQVAVAESLPGSVTIFDVASGELLRWVPAGASLVSLDWSQDGSRIAVSGNDASVTLIDASSGAPSLTLRGHAEPVSSVAFSPDGTRLASAGRGVATLVWDITLTGRGQEGAHPAPIGHVNHVAPDGQRVYSAIWGPGLVVVLDGRTWEHLHTLESQLVDHPWGGLALSPDGLWIATTDLARVTSIRDARTLEIVHELPAGEYVRAFSPDGSQVVADGAGSTVDYVGPPRVLDVASGQEVFRLERSGRLEVFGVQWSPDGALLAAASLDGFTRVYDAHTGRELAVLTFESGHPTGVAFRPDGSHLAISSNGGVFQVVDVASLHNEQPRVVATVPVRSGTSNIQQIAYARDGADLVAGGLNPEIGVWDADSFELRYTIRTPVPSAGMLLLPSGREVVSGVRGPGLVIFTLDVDRLIEIARSRLTRGFTEAECRRYLHVERCP